MRRLFALLLAFPLAAATPAADGLNAFAGDLYRQLARNYEGNLVFSPLSISTALAMTLAGARGQTAQEMTKVLRTPPDAALLEQLTKAGNAAGDQLSLAQSLWIDRNFTLQPDFLASSREQFHADPRTADFSTAPEAARAAINQWVSEQTHAKITDLFAPNSLKPDTRLVLASAVYFNGKWQSKFDPKSTAPAPFHGATEIQTPFMNQTARFPYAETGSAQVLELPYAGGFACLRRHPPQTRRAARHPRRCASLRRPCHLDRQPEAQAGGRVATQIPRGVHVFPGRDALGPRHAQRLHPRR